jgi:hypothetical protein
MQKAGKRPKQKVDCGGFREQVAVAPCSVAMKHAQAKGETRRDENSGQLVAGSLVAAFVALLFGACLLTTLDATRPGSPDHAVPKVGASSQDAVGRMIASR